MPPVWSPRRCPATGCWLSASLRVQRVPVPNCTDRVARTRIKWPVLAAPCCTKLAGSTPLGPYLCLYICFFLLGRLFRTLATHQMSEPCMLQTRRNTMLHLHAKLLATKRPKPGYVKTGDSLYWSIATIYLPVPSSSLQLLLTEE